MTFCVSCCVRAEREDLVDYFIIFLRLFIFSLSFYINPIDDMFNYDRLKKRLIAV